MKVLNEFSAGRLRLELELAAWRYGWRLPLSLAAVLAALGVCLLWLPLQYRSLENARVALEQDSARHPGVQAQTAQLPPLQQFREILAMQDATPAQLRLIHQKAVESGLSVAQLDMRRQQNPDGEFSQLQVSLPLKGNYAAFKHFSAMLLAQMPSVSIDQLSIRREQSNSSLVEVQLTLSLWQQATKERP